MFQSLKSSTYSAGKGKVTLSEGSPRGPVGLKHQPSIVEHTHSVSSSTWCAACIGLLYNVPHLSKEEVIHTQIEKDNKVTLCKLNRHICKLTWLIWYEFRNIYKMPFSGWGDACCLGCRRLYQLQPVPLWPLGLLWPSDETSLEVYTMKQFWLVPASTRCEGEINEWDSQFLNC